MQLTKVQKWCDLAIMSTLTKITKEVSKCMPKRIKTIQGANIIRRIIGFVLLHNTNIFHCCRKLCYNYDLYFVSRISISSWKKERAASGPTPVYLPTSSWGRPWVMIVFSWHHCHGTLRFTARQCGAAGRGSPCSASHTPWSKKTKRRSCLCSGDSFRRWMWEM